MARGQLLAILVAIIDLLSWHECESNIITNTQTWTVLENGERSYTLTSEKNACYIKLNLNKYENAGYLDCRNEYLTAGNNKICGNLNDHYQFPLKSREFSFRYRSAFPLAVEIEQLTCDGNQICDVTATDLYTEIISPNYPNEYPPSSRCRYTIIPGNEAICQVSFYFHEFDVEDSPDCTKDRLVIEDEPFCGKTKHYRINRNLTRSLEMKFFSDSSVSGRGFKINIQQIHCGNTLRYQGACCQREFKDPYMILTSPGFLVTKFTRSDCLYTISRSNGNVCRLRFYFRNFWLGEEDVFYGCVNGFLEIDKRRFCGCLDGYEYVSYFDEKGRKDLRLSYSGPGNRGFIIEVYQEQCGLDYPFANKTDVDPDTEVEVFTTNTTSEKSVSRFLVPRDDSRCYQWMQPGWEQQVRNYLSTSPVPAFCERRNGYQEGQFYPDDYPPEEPAYLPPPFVPPPDFPPVIPPPNLPPPFIPPSNLPPPPPPPPLPPNFWNSNCLILGNFAGRFTSPRYPSRYPANLRLCYAIERLPGICGVLITFKDFDVEKSIKCWKDYVRVRSQKRYCGDSLRGKTDVFEFGRDRFVPLHFVTDSCFAGRGFLGFYRQLPCAAPAKISSAKDHTNSSRLFP